MARYTGPVIDTHVHLSLDEAMSQPGLPPHGPAEYLAAAGDLEVRTAGALAIAPADDHDRTRMINDLVLGLARDDPRWFAMCSVHPFDGGFVGTELDRVLAAGARGIKLHPAAQNFDVDDARVTELVRAAGERGLPVLFDAWSIGDPAEPGKFAALSQACQQSDIILAHAFGTRFAELLIFELLGRHPQWWSRNVWIDLSYAAALYAGSPYHDHFAWVLRQVGIDRLLFASDYPVDPPVRAFAALETLGFTVEEQRVIAHDNAVALFGLDGPPIAGRSRHG